MSGKFDSRKDSHSTKLKRRPRIFVVFLEYSSVLSSLQCKSLSFIGFHRDLKIRCLPVEHVKHIVFHILKSTLEILDIFLYLLYLKEKGCSDVINCNHEIQSSNKARILLCSIRVSKEFFKIKINRIF